MSKNYDGLRVQVRSDTTEKAKKKKKERKNLNLLAD
jgi:hypothetical protein